MMGFRIFSGTALICWLFIVSPVNSSEDTFDDIIQDTMDSLVRDLTDKYSTDFDSNSFWHPYVYGTGNENREVIHVEEVKKEYISGDYFQWKYARLGLKHYIVGLSRHSIDLFGSDFRKITSVETSDDLEALAVYTRWNNEHYRPELIILAVTSEPRLNVYLLENNKIETVGSFPLHYDVKGIELCHVGSSTKVVIIPKATDVDIDIYNVEVGNSSTVWFFQRLPEAGSPNVVVFDSDMLESVIAVARDAKVEIYTFDSKEGLFQIYQSVTIPNPCRQLFSFTLSYQHYIGCIPQEENSPVLFIYYNYNTNEYGLDGNTFGNITAVEIYPVAVADYRDEYLLIVQDSEGLTHIMTYHGLQIGFQVEYTCNSEGGCPPVVDLYRGIGFRHNDSTAYVFPSGQDSKGSEVLLIKKRIKDSSSPVATESRNLYNTFQELSKRFADWERGVIVVQKTLDKQVHPDKPNLITGSWDVENLNASHVEFKEESLEYSESNTEDVFKVFKFMDTPWTSEDFLANPIRTVKELNTLQNNISFAQLQLLDAVLENTEYVQMVKATQDVSGTFRSNYLSVGVIDTTTIQDYRNATEFFDSLATKSPALHIRGHVVFNALPSMYKLNAEVINGIVVSDIARLSEENIFNCSLRFSEQFSAYENVSTKTVNGIDISTELVTPNNITGLDFSDGFVIKNNSQTSATFDFHKVLRSSSDQVVSSHVFFNNMKAATPITINSINEYSFYEFVSTVVSEDYSGEITGTKTVLETVEAESLNITSLWNYFPFPNAFVHKSQKRVVISGRKNFTYVTADTVTVGGKLDGLDPNSFVELSSSMYVNRTWRFVGDVSIINDISVYGTVDGILMENLKNSGTLDEYKESYTAVADVEFEQEIQIENLWIKSQINGDEFNAMFGNLLVFNGTHCKIPGTTTVDSSLTLDAINVDSNTINSYELKSFFNVGEEQNITGSITLTNECRFNSLFALERYDNVDLSGLLLHAVRLTGINRIPWKTHFDHIKCGAGMVVDSPINDVPYFGNSIAVTSGKVSQTILSDITFDNVVFYNLVVKDDVYLPAGIKLGGMDIVTWNSRRLSLTKDETFMYRFEIEGPAKVSYDVAVSSINDMALSALSESTFRTDRQSQSFKNVVNAKSYMKIINGEIRFEEEISGYSLDHLLEYAFPLNSYEGWLLLGGTWHFQSIQISENITVKGKTCGVELDALNMDSVRKGDADVELLGDNNFTSIKVKEGLTANYLNNKMNFENLFTLHGIQSIDCPFTFLQDVTVDGSLITDGKLNNISLGSLASQYSHDSENNVHIVRGDYFSGHNLTMESLKVAGDIQETNLLQHISKLLRTDDPNLSFNGMKVFEKPVVISGDADINLYNSIYPKDLHLLRLDDDIVFDDKVTFTGLVEAKVLEAYVRDIDPKKLVGIDWDDLISNSIPVNSTSPNAPLNLDDILVKRYLKVENFQTKPFTDYITLNGRQTISQLRVHKATIHGSNIPVSGLVNGVNLVKEFEDTLMKNSNPPYDVQGRKIFKGTVIVNGDFNCFGPQLKYDVIDISTDFNISSPVEFVNRLYVDGGVNVTEPVHGHTIDSIVSEALTQDHDQNITGEWEFSGGVVFKENVTGSGELQNFDLKGLIDRKNAEIEEANLRIAKEKLIFQEACYNVYNLTEELTSNPMKLDAFDQHQSIILRKQVEKVITVSGAGKLYLLTSSSTCEIVKYEWKPSTELFYKHIDGEHNQLRLGHVREWQSATHGSTGILVFSNQPSDCSTLQIGIHALALEPTEAFSTVSTLVAGDITEFKLVSDAVETAVFVLKQEYNSTQSKIEILVWKEQENRFVSDNEIVLDKSYERIELNSFRGGVGILLCSKSEASIFHYSWKTKSLVLIGSDYFLTDTTGTSLALFQSYDDLYALISQKMTQLSTLPSSCTVKILKVSDQEVHQLQQLPVQDLVSQTVIEFSGQIYVSTLSKSFGLSIYKFMGLNGLQLLNENPIKVFNGFQVYSFDVRPWRFSASRPFIVILTGKTIDVFHSNVYGDSLNLSSKNLCRVS